jgi:hypothetical protein
MTVVLYLRTKSLQRRNRRLRARNGRERLQQGVGTEGLLDHLVCAGDHRRRDREAEHLGGLEIDCKLEFRRLLQCVPENAIDIGDAERRKIFTLSGP